VPHLKRYLLDYQKDKYMTVFKHLVCGGHVTWSNLSCSHEDKWSRDMTPPTIGVIMNFVYVDNIFWTIEERAREVGGSILVLWHLLYRPGEKLLKWRDCIRAVSIQRRVCFEKWN